MSASDEWKDAQEWERKWHDNCVNSLNEELKQLVYARKMGLIFTGNGKTPYNILLNGKSVLDIGGGAYSLLLKASGFSEALVVDPCQFPAWVYARYDAAGIKVSIQPAEEMELVLHYDECWFYNCLQHVKDPAEVVKRSLEHSKLLRVFEWLDVGITDGHLHNLTKGKMDEWLNGYGKDEMLNETGCVGHAYYGIFKGKFYGE